MQLAVFRINNDTLYGIDIHNVIAFIIKNEISINDTPSSFKEVEGIATIRNEPNTLINIDKWINEENLKRTDLIYKLVIYSKFYKGTYGFLINDMVGIYDVKDQDITAIPYNTKVNSTCYIEINGKKDLCVLLNFEKLLTDVGVKFKNKD